MKCDKTIIALMHKQLDEEITADEYQKLHKHVKECLDCKEHFYELIEIETLLKNTPKEMPSDDFVNQVMLQLPKEKRRMNIQRWFSSHPFLVACAIFFVFMFGGAYQAWTKESGEFQVSGAAVKEMDEVIVNHEKQEVVIVEGAVVTKDLVVQNGNLRVEGELKGNAVIINGNQQLASAGEITGEIEEIDELFEWMWYKIKSIFE